MSQMNSSMNFLPEDYVEKRQAARSAVVFIGLLLVVVGGIIGAYMYTKWQTQEVFTEHDVMNRRFERASEDIEKAKQLDGKKEELIRKAEITSTLMERVRRSSLLGELSLRRPEGVKFVSMELKSKPLDAAQAKPLSDIERARRQKEGLSLDVKPPTMDVTVNLVGLAPTDGDVGAYMNKLQKSAIFSSVQLVFSEEYRKNKEDKPVRRFSVDLRIDPNANLNGPGAIVTAEPAKEDPAK